MVFQAQKGALLAGRYEFERPVGEGGMGAVWRARDLRLQCPVAVKVLYHDGRDSEAMSQRFLREARVAAAVQHVNVVRTTDFGIEDGTPYMVMELLEGESLADRMGKVPALTMPESLEITSSVLRGLAAAHDAGVIHRDIKPENVHLVYDRDGIFPKLLDFGVASALKPEGRVSVQTTQAGGLVGTPHYMSPEQARGLPDLDARSDIFSMGAMLYEMLTGTPPFDHDLPGDLLMAVVRDQHVPAVERRPEIGEKLSHVIDIALRKSREERYPTAHAMRQALGSVAPPASRPRMLVTGPVHLAETRAAASQGGPDSTRATLGASELLSGEMLPPPTVPSRRPLWIGAGILAVAILVAIGIVTGVGQDEVEQEEAAVPARPATPAAQPVAFPEPPGEESAPTRTAAPPADDTEEVGDQEAAEEQEVATSPRPRRRGRRNRRARMTSPMQPAESVMEAEPSGEEGMTETPTAFRNLDY